MQDQQHMPEHAQSTESRLVRRVVDAHDLKPDAIAAATGRDVSHVRRMLRGGYAVSADVARYVLKETGDDDLRIWMLGGEVDPAAVDAERLRAAQVSFATTVCALKRGVPPQTARERLGETITHLSALLPPVPVAERAANLAAEAGATGSTLDRVA